jgi:hypothetical protein
MPTTTATTAPVTGTPVGSVDPVLTPLPATPTRDPAGCPDPATGTCGVAAGLTWRIDPPARGIEIDARSGAGLAADDAAGATWSAITVRPVGDALAVGFRDQGSGQFLAIDLVDPDGTVGASVRLDHGRATVTGDRLETWSARFGPDDPNCCPSAWVHQVLANSTGGWIVASEDQVDQPPEGDFP